jgi:chromosome segregation ATPase
MSEQKGFEKWFTEKYSDLQFNKGGMIDSWNAAKADSEKEIERLKAQAALDESLMAESTRTIQELEAHINDLRKALEKYEDLINYQYTGSSEAISALQDASNHAEKILAKTPAQIRALKGEQNE